MKGEHLKQRGNIKGLRQNLQVTYIRPQDTANNDANEGRTSNLSDVLFLNKIYLTVLDHLSDSNFGNAHLAEKMQVSESQLFRKIKALTGQSTAIHIRSIRLQKGKELLLTSQLTVSEIAYETGFTSPFYFSRTFSKEFGSPPNSIRK